MIVKISKKYRSDGYDYKNDSNKQDDGPAVRIFLIVLQQMALESYCYVNMSYTNKNN